ncbi:MAG: glycoside hydrolase [Anaerolineae bacterium]|nr:glycoside hydrolase [Anaerolineae bacterium]
MVAVSAQWLASRRIGETPLRFSSIHGLSYTSDGRSLYVATSEGLRVYADNQWRIPDGANHDYRGFAGINNGFFTSGYRDPDISSEGLLGISRSTDDGATLTPVKYTDDLVIEILAAGYRSFMLFAFIPDETSSLSRGLHYSLDEGLTWQQSGTRGLAAAPVQLAVHPYEISRLAAATDAGVFMSSNYGDDFSPLDEGGRATMVAFDPEMGDELYFGFQQLYRYGLESRQTEPLPGPDLSEGEFFSYIAVNPVRDEIALATSRRRIYVTRDDGLTWQQIG